MDDTNSVADAKQASDPVCTLEDIEYLSDFTYVYSVDKNGDPVEEVDHTDGDFQCYMCGGCDEDFADFEEVKEHLNG